MCRYKVSNLWECCLFVQLCGYHFKIIQSIYARFNPEVDDWLISLELPLMVYTSTRPIIKNPQNITFQIKRPWPVMIEVTSYSYPKELNLWARKKNHGIQNTSQGTKTLSRFGDEKPGAPDNRGFNASQMVPAPLPSWLSFPPKIIDLKSSVLQVQDTLD